MYSYKFVSGNAEHPSDKIRNATLEVFRESQPPETIQKYSYSITKDGFVIIGENRIIENIDGTEE
jgi:DNA-directed RNA polymerase subunit L